MLLRPDYVFDAEKDFGVRSILILSIVLASKTTFLGEEVILLLFRFYRVLFFVLPFYSWYSDSIANSEYEKFSQFYYAKIDIVLRIPSTFQKRCPNDCFSCAACKKILLRTSNSICYYVVTMTHDWLSIDSRPLTTRRK